MRHIKFTHVDSVTGISVMDAPTSNGPAMPDVPGLVFGFAIESEYPALVPIFYGTCPDSSGVGIRGVIDYVSAAEYAQASDNEINARLEKLLAAKRDAATERRWIVETGGIALPNGIQISTDTDDQNRITSVIANAQLAGVETVDFKAISGWVTLTLAEIKAVAAAIALHVQACFSAERAHHDAIALLDTAQAIADYELDVGWPPNASP